MLNPCVVPFRSQNIKVTVLNSRGVSSGSRTVTVTVLNSYGVPSMLHIVMVTVLNLCGVSSTSRIVESQCTTHTVLLLGHTLSRSQC